ncbi:MAG: hypothetical protein AAFP69_14420, partial [Planctomycetota bacterium]
MRREFVARLFADDVAETRVPGRAILASGRCVFCAWAMHDWPPKSPPPMNHRNITWMIALC